MATEYEAIRVGDTVKEGDQTLMTNGKWIEVRLTVGMIISDEKDAKEFRRQKKKDK